MHKLYIVVPKLLHLKSVNIWNVAKMEMKCILLLIPQSNLFHSFPCGKYWIREMPSEYHDSTRRTTYTFSVLSVLFFISICFYSHPHPSEVLHFMQKSTTKLKRLFEMSLDDLSFLPLKSTFSLTLISNICFLCSNFVYINGHLISNWNSSKNSHF